ncbi:MAG TPA: TetR/AcrR family transcriptional regulator [Rhizomicrobium sp.]|nr:TetR/AcrR family transcriptional regulator [Rhizomicrobium sp.]
MRVTREQAAENRERIVHEAARLFREGGFAAVGVDAICDAAGLTHGNVYSRFRSKEAMMAAAVREGHAQGAARLETAGSLEEIAARYLSTLHRDNRGQGCFMAALGGEAPRQSRDVRKSFTGVVNSVSAYISNFVRGKSRRERVDEALAIASTMVGAMVLARAVDDKKLSDRILKAGRRHIALRSDRNNPAPKA